MPSHCQVDEAKALHFFRSQVASILPGAFNSTFWNRLVLQLSESEPIVRHALVAIGTLSQNIPSINPGRDQEQQNQFALQHYNRAIQKLRQVQYEPIILLACLLFACIEILQGNKEQAILHCRYGLAILGSVHNTALWAREHVRPTLKRLGALPLFFGTIVPGSCSITSTPIPKAFTSLEEANCIAEDLLAQSMSLLYCGDAYRNGSLFGQPVRSDLFASQAALIQSANQFRCSLKKLEKTHILPLFDDLGERQTTYMCLDLRNHIGLILLRTALEPDEMGYDRFSGNFRHALRLARRLHHAMAKRFQPSVFEMRFEPVYLVLIQVILLRCRILSVRLEALNLLKTYGAAKEGFWERDKMYQLGRRIIEIEHDITLDETDKPIGRVLDTALPPDNRRIRNTIFDERKTIQGEVDGSPVRGSPVGFIMQDITHNLLVQYDFILVTPVSSLSLYPRATSYRWRYLRRHG